MVQVLTPIPAVWDRMARDDPDRAIACIPIGTEVEQGYRDITARAMADAINRAAWFLERELGRSETFQTICYLGPSDLRYPILMSAAAKTGHKTFWTSPRNSLEAHVRLMEATECAVFLTPAVIPPGVSQILERVQMRHITVPEQADWIDGTDPVELYAFNKTYDQCRLDPLTVIHTSGSTGFPKPIIIPQGFGCLLEALVKSPHPKGQKNLWRWFSENPGKIYTPFPMFHGAGIMVFNHFAQFLGNIPVLPPPNKPVTSELSNEIIASGVATSAFLPPAIIDGFAKDPELAENLRKLKFFIFSGAPLSVELGDFLRSKTRIFNSYGQTETGILNQLYTDDEDYAYVNFGPLSNIELQHHSDDLYEAVMVRKEGLEQYQGGFMVDPEAAEIRTRDLFSRHPDPAKGDLWIHRGRADDVIVFDTGEKINPASMESLIGSHGKVRSALVVGEGRFQSALLIEPVKDVQGQNATEALLEELWPTIEAANKDCPAHGQVVRNLVMFTKPGVPFVRSGKGSVRRRATLELYEEDIEAVYKAAGNPLDNDGPVIDPTASKEALAQQLREVLLQATKVEASSDEDNLYQLGMDSLQTLQLSRSLKASLRHSGVWLDQITPNFIYSNPTLHQLIESIYRLCHADSLEEATETSQIEEMKAILSNYAPNIPKGMDGRPDSKVFILTGSTGSFGSYLLHSLLQQPSIKHVYCLNRSVDASARQTSANTTRGLTSSFEPVRVTFMTCDFSKPLLGLERSSYGRLLGQITHIIHNAWTVNFNLSLSTFAATNIFGIKSLIEFTVEAPRQPQIFFVSSMGTVMRWRQAGHSGPVPEEPIDDPHVPEAQGYARSKWIAERLLDLAHAELGIDVCYLRVGQIAGPVGTTQGAWNKTEWFPAFMTSCRTLGLLPNSLEVLDVIDWIPVNVLADVVVELVNRGARVDGQGSLVYNLVNPSTATWSELCPVVQRGLSQATGSKIDIVTYSEWLRALEKAASETKTDQDMRDNPAIKLLDFFQGLENRSSHEHAAIISTKKATENSPALQKCGPVTPEWMSLWLEQLRLSDTD